MLEYDRLYYLELRNLMAISEAFQAQLTRLSAYVATLDAGPDAKDAEDTAALSAALDTAGAPPVEVVTPPADTAPAA